MATKPAPVSPAPVTPSPDAGAPAVPAGTPPAPAVSPDPVAADPKQQQLAVANQAVNSHHGTESDTKDSVGKPKEGGKPAPIGGRGVNAPRDSKPAPTDKEKRAAQPKVTVTDKVDNAGNEKSPGHHIGIRGNHTSRDTYKL